MTAEPIVTYRTRRGDEQVVEVDEWPEQTWFVRDLTILDPALVRRVEDLILVTVTNGNATYRIVRDDEFRGRLECVLEDADLAPRGPF